MLLIRPSNIDLGDGSNFTVHLDSRVIPPRRVFDGIDDLHHFMDSIDASGQVLLNKNLYLRLKHALFPNEIAAVDMDGIAIVGKYKYVISEEAVSRTSTEGDGKQLEVETYHGISGDAYLDEFAALARNISNIDELEDFEFKDPEIRSLYNNLKTEIFAKVTTTDRVWHGPVGSNQFPFDDPTTGEYTIALSGMHDRGYIFWNQSTGRFTRRAIAHTSLLFSPQYSSSAPWYGYNYGYYGTHLHSSYNTTNYVKTVVSGGRGTATCTGDFECTVRVKRKRRRGAESWHTSGYSSSTFVLESYDVNSYHVQ